MLDSVVIDTNAYERRQDELEADGQTRDELRAEHVKEWLETWRSDASYLCMKLARCDGADNECGDVLEAMQGLQQFTKFSPEWLRAAIAFTDGVKVYAEQLALEAYPE